MVKILEIAQRRKFIILVFMILHFTSIYAQKIITSGVLTYERKENMFKLLESMEDDSWSEILRQNLPKYRTDIFELKFTINETFYNVTLEDENPMANWWRAASTNKVKADFKSSRMQSEKTIYERIYMIDDTLPQMKWKIYDEYRDISGYSCRKASTIIHDSIYAIAFYCEDIPVSGGPESFNGLPGMILGLVIPRLNTTWFVTNVRAQTFQPNDLDLKSGKLKSVKISEYLNELKMDVKDWGKYGPRLIWRALI